MVNSNSNTDGIPVTVTFTDQGAQCFPPAMLEALRTANFRVTLPSNLTNQGSTVIRASTLPDNITRIDNEGAIYTPGITKLEVPETTVTIAASVAPGVPVEMIIPITGVSDLQNTINNILFDVQPPESPIYIGPPRLSGNTIRYSVYRVDNGSTPPYPVVSVRAFGRLFIVPSPSPL